MPNRRPNPNPSAASDGAVAFTRSQRETFLHRTRSGRSRPDSATGRGLENSLETFLVPPLSKHRGICFSYDRNRNRLSIKDLRARRVFSPSSISVESGIEKSGDGEHGVEGIEDLLDERNDFESRVEDSDRGTECARRENVDSYEDGMEGVEDFEEGFDGKVGNDNRVDEVLEGVEECGVQLVQSSLAGEQNNFESQMESTRKHSDGMDVVEHVGAVQKDSGVDEVLEGFSVDLVQSTPPTEQNNLESRMGSVDRRMECGEKENVDFSEDGMDGVESRVDGVLEGYSVDFGQCTPPDEHNALGSQKGSVDRSMDNSLNNCHSGAKMDSTHPPKSRQGVARRSQLRLFQKKSSFGYRRMLPFLMDLVKDDSNAVPTLPSQHFSTVKGEKLGEERPLRPLVETSPKKMLPLEESGSSLKDETPNALSSDFPLSSELNKTPELVDVPVTGSISRQVGEDIYQNTNSFGYRRMLPFLMDLVKNTSDAVHILPCQNSSVNDEQLGEERPSLPQVETLPKEMLPLEESDRTLKDETPKSLHSGVPSSGESNKIPDLVNVPASGSISQVTEDILQDPPVHIPNSCNEAQLCATEPDTSVEYIDIIADLLCVSPQLQLAVPESSSMDELADKVSFVSELPRAAQSSSRKIAPAMEVERNPSQANQSSFVHPSQKLSLAPRKGILKKNTKGCKGICMCLDCASFRIHADRAFEFSRKQLEEADEITVGLVKELCSLRNLLEKSATPIHSSRIDPLSQLNEELIKAACHRASRAEEVAKGCIRKMFSDLNMHCRIPGPRVTFEESLEEKMP